MLARHNQVLRIGRWVVKRLRGQKADRRFWSERETRRLLLGRGVNFVPVIASSATLRAIILPRVAIPVHYDDEAPRRLASHVLLLENMLEVLHGTHRIGWLDRPQYVVSFDSFGDFLLNETDRYLRRFGPALLGAGDARWLPRLFEGISWSGPLLICLTDCSLKNVVETSDGFCHFDFESTLVAPRQVFLAKVALNLVRDSTESQRTSAFEGARLLLKQCDDDSGLRAALAFFLVRMAVYAQVWNAAATDPAAALKALRKGAPAAEVLMEICNA